MLKLRSSRSSCSRPWRVTVRVSAPWICRPTTGSAGSAPGAASGSGGKARLVEGHGSGLILHADLAGEEQDAVFALVRAAPELRAADTDLRDRGRNRDLLVAHVLELSGREAERALGHGQQHIAHALVGVVDVAVDHDDRVFPQRQHRVVAKGHLRMAVGPGLELIVQVHRGALSRARARAARDDFGRAFDVADGADGVIGGVGSAKRGDEHKDGRENGPAPAERSQGFDWGSRVHGALRR